MSRIPGLIKQKRLSIKESQSEFGKRFNVSHASVSQWESGINQAPYEVIEFCLEIPTKTKIQHLNFGQFGILFEEVPSAIAAIEEKINEIIDEINLLNPDNEVEYE